MIQIFVRAQGQIDEEIPGKISKDPKGRQRLELAAQSKLQTVSKPSKY